ncbi:MAG: Hsp20/alpha crystallin family protein [Acidobacteriota bacterium]
MGQRDAQLPVVDVGDLTEVVGRIFEDLDRVRPSDRRLPPGIFTPALDAFETDGAVEIAVDLPGTAPDDLRVLISGNVVIVAGGKRPPLPEERSRASFHQVERDFGRFARAIRLTGAFMVAEATAIISNGELRVRIPRIEERRGRDVVVPIRRQ